MPYLLTAQTSSSFFFETNKTQRNFSLLAAVGITLLFFAQFKINFELNQNEITTQQSYTELRFINVIPAAPTTKPVDMLPKQTIKIAAPKTKVIQQAFSAIKKPTNTNAITITNAPEKMATEDVFAISPNKNKVDENTNAEPTFKYDSESVRKAYQDSKTDIEKMSEARGVALVKTPHASEVDRFNESVKKAAKKDCFSANSGGSLLSIFVIPIMAATDKCKM